MHVAGFDAGAEVLDHPVRLEDVTADLVAPGGRAFFAVESFHLLLLRIDSLGVNPRQQQFHRGGAVLVLGTLTLARDDQAGRDVGDADGGFDFIHILTAFAARAEGIDAELSGRDNDVGRGLFDFGNDIDAGEAGVAAFVRIEGGNADQPMDAPLRLAIAGQFLDQRPDYQFV